MNAERMLAGFLQYVRMDTTANEAVESYPSSPGQRELGALLVRQLQEFGVADAHQDEHGLVWATIPATVAGDVPVVALEMGDRMAAVLGDRQRQDQALRGDPPLDGVAERQAESDDPEGEEQFRH